MSHTELNGNGNGISVLNGYLDLKLNSNVHDNSDSGIWINSIGYTGTATEVSHSDVTANGNYGVYLQVYPGDPLPHGNHNNIYDNNTAPGSNSNARQLFAYYAAALADWTENYWGENLAASEHQCTFNAALKHQYWSTVYSECISAPPSGPTSYLLFTQANTCPGNQIRYCPADNINNLSAVLSRIDNSSY